MVRTSVQGWLSPAPGSLGWGPIVARLPSFGQVPPSTLPDFFLAKLMPRLPTRPPRRIPLVTPTLLSSLICRADCRCRDGVVSPALAPPQDWPCAAPGPTQPGSQKTLVSIFFFILNILFYSELSPTHKGRSVSRIWRGAHFRNRIFPGRKRSSVQSPWDAGIIPGVCAELMERDG